MKLKKERLKMINLLSAFVLSVCGCVFIIRYESKKKLCDFNLIMAIWVLILAGMNLEKFIR